MSKSFDNRIEKINAMLISHGEVKVNELAMQMNVSKETIRKDLEFLESQNVLLRTHGGAIIKNSSMISPFDIRQKEKADIKKRLCLKALSFINNDDSIFIDPSSTASYLVRLLTLRKNITITTNSLSIAEEAININAKTFFVGGVIDKRAKRSSGSYALKMVNDMSFDIAFFGSDGCLVGGGVGTHDEEEIILSNTVAKRSAKKVLLIDSSKFYTTSRFKVANFSDFDIIITDFVPDDFDLGDNIKTLIEVDKEEI